MIKSAENLSIEKLLGKDNNNKEVFYKIPPYQREYSWKKGEWENLFNDINDNEKGYFLGSIICINQNEDLEVIDGQQRLTTISILLLSLLNFINIYNSNHQEERILDLGSNEEYASLWSMLRKFLALKKLQKLKLSIQNQNNEDYQYLLFQNKLIDEVDRPKKFGTRRISKSYEYFKNRLEEIDSDEKKLFSIQDIFELLEKILSALIVKIEVDSVASAFILFESINNRGMPLTPIDLIKNSIIGTMEKSGGKAPEQTNKEWQVIIQNIEDYNEQIRFLRHYYHAFQYCKIKVKIDRFTKATKSNIMKIYPEHINNDVQFIFNELIEKSKTYTVFINPDNIDESSSFFKYQDKLIDLQRLGIAPAYSLFLYLFVEEKDTDFSNILNFIENWFLRRHITDYPSTNKLDQIFLNLINLLCVNNKEKEPKDIEKLIFEFLLNSDRYRSDEDFQNILLTSKLYDTNRGATRCLLTKLEKSKRTKENSVDFWETTNTKKPTLVWTIEHIYPQTPNKESDWYTTCNKEERTEYLHKLGNLTLTRYNSTYSNKSYKDKIEVIDENQNDIGLKSGKVEINKYLIDNTDNEWCVEHIVERGKELVEEIIVIMNK